MRDSVTREVVQEGDFVVTRVARHYSIGQMTADGRTQFAVEAHNDRDTAIRLAWFLAGTDHRVFLCDRANSGGRDAVHVDRPPITEAT